MGSSLTKKIKGSLAVGMLLIPLAFPLLSVQAGYSSVDQISEKHWKVIRAAASKAKELGFTAESFAGIMGNANEESGFDATLEEEATPQPGNSKGIGLFQWTNTRDPNTGAESLRRDQYVNWVNEKGYKLSDPEQAGKASIEYMYEEQKGATKWGDSYFENYINTPWGKPYENAKQKYHTFEEFMKADDVEAAALGFMAGFERPGTRTQEARVNMAKAIYEKIKDDYGTISSDSKDSSKKKDSVSDNLKRWSEDAIPNMPKDRDYGKEEQGFKGRLDKIEKLKGDEATSIAKWKEEREVSLQKRTIKGARLVVMVLSMLALVYPSILLLAYVFDSWFVYIDSPAMRVVTFNYRAIEQNRNGSGGLWFADKKENAKLKTKRLGLGDTLIWAAIFSLAGVLGVSGIMYETAGSIWQFISDSIGYVIHG